MSTLLRQRMHQDLQLAGLAEGTQNCLPPRRQATRRALPQAARTRSPSSQSREYLLYLKNRRNYSPSSLKIAASGIIFFYTHTVPRDWATFKNLPIPRPKTCPTS